MSSLSACALAPEAFRDVVKTSLQRLMSGTNSAVSIQDVQGAGDHPEVLRFLALAAYERWSKLQLEEACKTAALPAPLAAVLSEEWTAEGPKVIGSLENSSLWHSTPQLASWRVDMVTAAKAEAAEGLAEPIAMFEIQAKQRHSADGSTGALRWEANKEQMQQLLQACEDIEAAIAVRAE